MLNPVLRRRSVLACVPTLEPRNERKISIDDSGVSPGKADNTETILFTDPSCNYFQDIVESGGSSVMLCEKKRHLLDEKETI